MRSTEEEEVIPPTIISVQGNHSVIDMEGETDMLKIPEGYSSAGSTSSSVGRSGNQKPTHKAQMVLPGSNAYTKGKKLGHRRVTEDGGVTFKKFEVTQLIGSIQLGLQQSIGSLAGQQMRDILMPDFMTIETVAFTRDGAAQKTPAHNYSEFRFRTYASYAFKCFRQMFAIEESDFLVSLVGEPMRQLSNSGASGSIFYLTADDKFICKTVQHKEAEFLQKLLPGYYMNLKQNPRTLLPKFFGLYCYCCNAKNVRIIIMNNLLPSGLKMHYRFDLKGSTYKRKASRSERAKSSPTYKDLDFMEMNPEGIFLHPELYDNLLNTIQRDCRVLESFKIMDYSLLIGIHNLDQAAKEKSDKPMSTDLVVSGSDTAEHVTNLPDSTDGPTSPRGKPVPMLERQGSILYRDQRTIAHTTALESITIDLEEDPGTSQEPTGGYPGSDVGSCDDHVESGSGRDETDDMETGIRNVWGGIPAKNHKGENLLLFIGVIDILQEYGVLKKAEHYWKSFVHDGDTVSVHRPSFYAKRFQSFMKEKVFKRLPPSVPPLRPTLSFRRSNNAYRRTLSREDNEHLNRTGTTSPSGLDHSISADVTDSSAPQRGVKDHSVTVITIGSDTVPLPAVLQDRPKPVQQSMTTLPQPPAAPTGSNSGSTGSVPQITAHRRLHHAPHLRQQPRPDLIDGVSSPGTPSPGLDDRLETGSIITMTSDERVQIYVPSPQSTPYNTITKSQSALGAVPGANPGPGPWSGMTESSRALPWAMHVGGAVSAVQLQGGVSPQGSHSWREDATPPPFAQRAATSSESAAYTPNERITITKVSHDPLPSTEGASAAAASNTSTTTVKIALESHTDSPNHEAEVPEVCPEEVHLSLGASESQAAPESLSSSEKTLMDDLPSLPSDRLPPSAAATTSSAAVATGPVSLSDIMLMEEDQV